MGHRCPPPTRIKGHQRPVSLRLFFSCSVDPIPEEADASARENFNHLSSFHSSISTGEEMPEEGELFVSSQLDAWPVTRPETPSVLAAEVESVAEGGRVLPRPHSHPGVAPANGDSSSKVHMA